MSYFQKQLFCCILSLLLILSSCTLLSFHYKKELGDLQALCRALPRDLSDKERVYREVVFLEDNLKKAGTSLAFFINYDQLNSAYLAAATLKRAVLQGDEREYARAAVCLDEAIGTLLRFEAFSLKTLI